MGKISDGALAETMAADCQRQEQKHSFVGELTINNVSKTSVANRSRRHSK